MNDSKIPSIGLGTWQINNYETMKAVISCAYAAGYRLIDTAAAYANEIIIGKAIKELSISRDELFLTDKVWNRYRSFQGVQDACRRSLRKLKTDCIDLYLMHWPASMELFPNWAEINAETWLGMKQLQKDGLVRMVGVSNFKQHHLEDLYQKCGSMPEVNQIELHPGYGQNDLLIYCQKKEIQVEASSPLGNGQILSNSTVAAIADKYQKEPAQICLRWIIQRGAIPLPKSISPERIRGNIAVFDFNLSETEMKEIDEIPWCGGFGIDPDKGIEFA